MDGCLLAGALQSPLHTATERHLTSSPGSPSLQQKAASHTAPCVCLGTHTHTSSPGWLDLLWACVCAASSHLTNSPAFCLTQPLCLRSGVISSGKSSLTCSLGQGSSYLSALRNPSWQAHTPTCTPGCCSHTRSSRSHGPAWLESVSSSFCLVKICLLAVLRREGFSNSETVCHGPVRHQGVKIESLLSVSLARRGDKRCT